MNSIECPYCDGIGLLETRDVERKYRGELFQVVEHYYKCNMCGYQFTTNEIDSLDTEQVYNQYREKNGIPSAFQIAALKQKYEVSYVELSEILGFGANVFKNYVDGEVPSESNGKTLGAILNPEVFKIYVEKASDFKNKLKILDHVDNIIEQEKKTSDYLKKIIDEEIPNQYTGYRLPSVEKFGNMVLFFLESAPFKVRLNKLLFYADFLHYKYFGFSISGWKYQALPLGIVPIDYLASYDLLLKEKYIDTEEVEIGQEYFDKFIKSKDFKRDVFSDSEFEVLNMVAEKLGHLNRTDIVSLNHEEEAWINEKDHRGIVSYQKYAFQIKADEIAD